VARSKQAKKKPSRLAYEETHPTISFRLDIETHDRLKEHLKATGSSFADFVKDALGREETMVEERVTKLASKKIAESETPARDLELYDIVLDLARWGVVLWANLPDPTDGVPCPDCLFPSRLSKKESKAVTLEMVENGDFKCPECGLRLKNPPQLAWVLLVSKVEEEVLREKFLKSQENEADEAAGKDESVS
jgi:predicted DNA-binding protein